MAKIPFSKLKLTKKDDVNTIIINDNNAPCYYSEIKKMKN